MFVMLHLHCSHEHHDRVASMLPSSCRVGLTPPSDLLKIMSLSVLPMKANWNLMGVGCGLDACMHGWMAGWSVGDKMEGGTQHHVLFLSSPFSTPLFSFSSYSIMSHLSTYIIPLCGLSNTHTQTLTLFAQLWISSTNANAVPPPILHVRCFFFYRRRITRLRRLAPSSAWTALISSMTVSLTLPLS